MEVFLITKNKGKYLAAKKAFNNTNITLKQLAKDVEEIQAENSAIVAEYCVKELSKMAEYKNKILLREDHSLYINYLGLPGPFTKYIQKNLPADRLLEILKNKDHTGYFELSLATYMPEKGIKTFTYNVPIRISDKEKGNLAQGWDKILMLENETRTFAEYPESERLDVWNKNFINFILYLKKDDII